MHFPNKVIVQCVMFNISEIILVAISCGHYVLTDATTVLLSLCPSYVLFLYASLLLFTKMCFHQEYSQTLYKISRVSCKLYYAVVGFAYVGHSACRVHFIEGEDICLQDCIHQVSINSHVLTRTHVYTRPLRGCCLFNILVVCL